MVTAYFALYKRKQNTWKVDATEGKCGQQFKNKRNLNYRIFSKAQPSGTAKLRDDSTA